MMEMTHEDRVNVRWAVGTWVITAIIFLLLGMGAGKAMGAEMIKISKMQNIDDFIQEVKDGLHPNTKLCEVCGLPGSKDGSSGLCSGDSAWKKYHGVTE